MASFGHNSAVAAMGGGSRMYAISLDLDTETLEQSYDGPSWRNAYADIRNTLRESGFEWQQGSVYFGTDDAVACVLAAQRLTRRYPWFRPSVRDIRMLRIEESNGSRPGHRRCADPLSACEPIERAPESATVAAFAPSSRISARRGAGHAGVGCGRHRWTWIRRSAAVRTFPEWSGRRGRRRQSMGGSESAQDGLRRGATHRTETLRSGIVRRTDRAAGGSAAANEVEAAPGTCAS